MQLELLDLTRMDKQKLASRPLIWMAVLILTLTALILIPEGPKSPQLVKIPMVISWEPNSFEVGVSGVVSNDIRIPTVGPPSTYSLSEYVDSGVLRALPYFESGRSTSEIRTEAYSIDLAPMLNQPKNGIERSNQSRSASQYAILIMQVINGGDVFLNGIWIHGLPRSDKLTRRVWYQPMLVPIPSRLLNQHGQENKLTVIQSTYEPYSIIPNIYFGEYADLSQVAAVVNLFSNTLANTSIIFCLIVGIFMVGAWMASPKSALFFYAGCAAITWAILFTLALWPILPVSWMRTWRTILFGAEGTIMVVMSLFVLISAELTIKSAWKAFWLVYVCAAPIMYFMEGESIERDLNIYWTIIGVSFYSYACIRLTIYAWRTSNGSAFALMLVSVVSMILAVHDYAVVTGLLNFIIWSEEGWTWWELLTEPIYLTHLGLPLQLIVTGKVLLSDYGKMYEKVRKANAELGEALRRRENELQRTYEAKRLLVQQFVQRREQDRIYQDIHDGVGSKLVSLLFSLKSGKVKPEATINWLEACIRDLRNVISATADESDDLQLAIFDICLSLEEQLDGSEIILSYDISSPQPIRLDRKRHIQAVRSFQEMLTNAVKHSGARHIHVTLSSNKNSCEIVVQDDGRGMPIDDSNEGNSGKLGVKGLTSRAAALLGECRWDSSPGIGTSVKLNFPTADISTEEVTCVSNRSVH